MLTVTFRIKPYLAAYMYARYSQFVGTFGFKCSLPLPIKLSDRSPIYYLLHECTERYPEKPGHREEGNITFFLPAPNWGKKPESFNYIGAQSAHRIQEAIDYQLHMELYDYLTGEKFKRGVMFKNSLHKFVCRYGMEELVTEEALMRAFQRWRQAMREERMGEERMSGKGWEKNGKRRGRNKTG